MKDFKQFRTTVPDPQCVQMVCLIKEKASHKFNQLMRSLFCILNVSILLANHFHGSRGDGSLDSKVSIFLK
ncbi:hypothetical protein Q75_14820 [Bacillus coahuilensis p1.1.43]|uniref:Uncharacterized protein n=1 Tax=Bacillus coahuilensis p1.1.43 TaxID=1150625 RepID=A0A147K537_9BACI|nr:hypothetical protein Q75_14820 [Bacillus coahuilensis p1.1.43]